MIPIYLVFFTFGGAYLNNLINKNNNIPLLTIIRVCIPCAIAFYLYIIYTAWQHQCHCNIVAYYKLSLGIANDIFDKYKVNEKTEASPKDKTSNLAKESKSRRFLNRLFGINKK